MILINARALMAGGHFRGVDRLDTVRPTDPQRSDADRLAPKSSGS